MNLLLLDDMDLSDDASRAVVTGSRAKHIISVLNASAGDSLQAGIVDGLMGSAVIESISDESVALSLNLDRQPPEPLPLTLVLAMPRPKVFRRMLISLTSMGIKDIILINAFRVEKSYWQSPVLSDESVSSHLRAGLEQACDTVMPAIQMRRAFKPFAEDELPSLLNGGHGLVAHPYASGSAPVDCRGHIVLAVGPEGGFIDYEIEKLTAAGMKQFSLGERILRVDTAVPYIAGRLFG